MGERTNADARQGVRHPPQPDRLFSQKTPTFLAELGVESSNGAVWNWVHRLADSGCDPPTVQPSRVAVNETAVKINGEQSWLYAGIDVDTKLILDVALFGRHGTDPAAAFLRGLMEKNDCSESMFLVAQYGYRTTLARLGLSGRVNYTERNLIEKWFHTLKIRVDRFHNSWMGSRRTVREWLAQFIHYYNQQRPHQALDGRMTTAEVLN